MNPADERALCGYVLGLCSGVLQQQGYPLAGPVDLNADSRVDFRLPKNWPAGARLVLRAEVVDEDGV